jgi:hypothetical protein
MVHLEPWIHQRIETSIRSIFHVSPRIMAVPISPYEQLESKRVHRQLQHKKRNRTSGYSHRYAYQDQQELELLQNTQNDSSSYHRTHRAHLLLHRTEHPLILNIYFNNSSVFFTHTFLPKDLATEQTISTCILVKFLKLQRVPSSNKRGNTILSSLKSIKDSHQLSLDIGESQVVNFNPTRLYKSIKSNFLKGCIRILILTHALCTIFSSTHTV